MLTLIRRFGVLLVNLAVLIGVRRPAAGSDAGLERFQDAKFLLTTQPTAQDLAFAMGDFDRNGENYAVDAEKRGRFAGELDQWLQSFDPDKTLCSGEPRTVGASTRYVFAMSAIRLAAVGRRISATGAVATSNTTTPLCSIRRTLRGVRTTSSTTTT